MYHVMTSQGQQGPYHIDQIKSMCASGVLTTESLCWTEPWTEWRPVADVIDRGEPKVGIPSRMASEPAPVQAVTQAPPSLPASDLPSSGAINYDDFLCCRCAVRHPGTPSTTPLGLRKFQCGSCGHANKYPPSTTYMALYWTAIVATFFAMRYVIVNGGVAMPGLLGLVAVSGLVEGYAVKRRVKKSRKFFMSKAQQQG